MKWNTPSITLKGTAEPGIHCSLQSTVSAECLYNAVLSLGLERHDLDEIRELIEAMCKVSRYSDKEELYAKSSSSFCSSASARFAFFKGKPALPLFFVYSEAKEAMESALAIDGPQEGDDYQIAVLSLQRAVQRVELAKFYRLDG